MKLKDLAVKYSLEFLVIVLGISVSFWLNQIAVERVEEQERIKVLQSLHAELEEIDKYCRERKDNYRDDIDILDALLEEGFDPDRFEGLTTSKARIEFILTRYRVFEPPMNQYQSIIHAGALKYLKSDKVNDKLGQLHNTFLRYMQTSVNYERELKQAFMPFLTSEHPEIVLAKVKMPSASTLTSACCTTQSPTTNALKPTCFCCLATSRTRCISSSCTRPSCLSWMGFSWRSLATT